MKRIKELLMFFSLILAILIVFSSCKQTQQTPPLSVLNEEDVSNIESLVESKTLRVYNNGLHTFALWDYDKENETMILLFDGNKIIHSHYVFEEMNNNETITFYNGSDKDYNWRIQVSYDNIEEKYTFFFGDDENKLLYNNEDFSGEYYFLEEKNISLDKKSLENPLDFKVIERTQEEINSNTFESRANGIWHYTISKIDMQTLKIHDNGLFELYYLSVGEVKEVIKGTYTIISDDGEYQEFKFVNVDDATDTWVAKILQTDLKDDYGTIYDGIIYINSENETFYYTGTKW